MDNALAAGGIGDLTAESLSVMVSCIGGALTSLRISLSFLMSSSL